MKKLLLSLTLLVGIAVHAAADPTAKAIYCAANTTLYFTYDEVTYDTSTAYDQLDGKTPTAVYTNIRTTGYAKASGQGGDNLPWNGYLTKITTVKFLENFSGWSPTSLGAFFARMSKLATIEGGEYLNTSNVTSFREIFYQCDALTNLDFLSTWDTGNVKDLSLAFFQCRGLEDVNGLKNWNVSNVESLESTFFFCHFPDVEAFKNWDVSNVTNMDRTFDAVRPITSLEGLKDWNVSKVETMTATFSGTEIKDVNCLANWKDKLGNVTTIDNLFMGCRSLEDISGLSEWGISNVIDINQIFYHCISLKDISPLANWDTSNVINMGWMFADSGIEYVDAIANWDVRKVKALRGSFRECKNLKSINPLNNWETESLIDLSSCFLNCSSITGRVDLSNWDLSNLKVYHWAETDPINYADVYDQSGFGETFSGLTGVIGITIGKGNVGLHNFEDFWKNTAVPYNNSHSSYPYLSTYRGHLQAFYNCPKLRYIDFSGCTDPYGNITYAYRESVEYEYTKPNGTPGTASYYGMFGTVPRTCVIYLPSGNSQPTEGNHENVVYTEGSKPLQCDKYYSEDKVDIELPHRFHADLATYERPFSKTYAGVILPYPVKINDNASDEFQPFILQEEYVEQMFFKGSDNVPANTPFVFKRKGSTDMKFAMEDVWVESTYDISGETSDNIDPTFTAWKSQGFYVTHEIEPENGKFNIPTMDDYVGTETVAYDPNRVYYIASNKFYRTDPSTLYLDPHRILYFGKWEKFSGDISGARPAAFTIEELDENSPAITAIQEAELRLDESRAAAIYDASGNRLSETKRGVNILRMADGSVKKVLRK